jgi:lysyl-tRNA synthetase class 2
MAEKRLGEIRKIRLEKVKELRKLGINPYPSTFPTAIIPVEKARRSLGKKIAVAGRIWFIREHGDCTFADLKDASGQIQLFCQKKNLGKSFDLLKLIDAGDFVWTQGRVTKTQTGELSVDISKFQLLTKSIRPLPSTWHGLRDVEERYRQRYVDLLLNDKVKEVFKTRTKIIKLLRKYLDDHGFIEVKTPALQPIYGGATARPFITHHNDLDIDLYLRIADELYLKRLIVGGFEKVYEVCTDFRNEGIDRWHNPEFTQLEFYWAYADYEDLMTMTEEMLSSVVKEIKASFEISYEGKKISFKPPWKRLTFREAILKEVGVDIDKIESAKELMEVVSKKKGKIDLEDTQDLPSLLDALYKRFVRPKIIHPTFVIDHPYSMRPLAKRKESDPTKTESIQPVAGGAELLNAYSELNDPVDQKARWLEDMKRAQKGVEEYQVLDEDYIRALEYGMPPTAGWGMGIDRFTALLTDQHSLKDTILFPTLRPEK